MKKTTALLAGIMTFGLFCSGCAVNGESSSPTPSPSTGSGPYVPGESPYPQVTIEMENGKKIVLELYPEKAPNTVNNFISLIQDKFYDGLKFHRVKKDFMIQGGDPQGTGTGGPGYSIKGEFSENGVENDLSHTDGVISMARSQSFDSAGSQFFICSGNASFLDGQYAAFGKVISGIEEVHAIAELNTSEQGGSPSLPQVIKLITVDTFGVTYPSPETIQR